MAEVVAVFVIEDAGVGDDGRRDRERAGGDLTGRSKPVQVTVRDGAAYVQPVAALNASPAGSTSETSTSWAVFGPSLRTASAYSAASPACSGPAGPVFVRCRSARVSSATVAVSLSLPGFGVLLLSWRRWPCW